MSVCGPSNAIPSCAATPSVGFGSRNRGFGSSYGLGSVGSSSLGSIGYSLGSGATVSAGSLGVLQGVHPSCINQTPPCEVVMQPPPVVVTFPGPIMAATPVPIYVGGYSPCSSDSSSGFGYGGVSVIGSGHGYSQGLLGSSLGSVGRGINCTPCV